MCLLPCAAVSSVLLAVCDNTVILSSCVLKNRDKEALQLHLKLLGFLVRSGKNTVKCLQAKRIDGLGRGEAGFLFLCIPCTGYENGLEEKPALSQAVITVRTAMFYPGSCVFCHFTTKNFGGSF